jgi:hypothetical protein
MATSWHRQLDYNFIYDNEGTLEKIIIENQIHWQID